MNLMLLMQAGTHNLRHICRYVQVNASLCDCQNAATTVHTGVIARLQQRLAAAMKFLGVVLILIVRSHAWCVSWLQKYSDVQSQIDALQAEIWSTATIRLLTVAVGGVIIIWVHWVVFLCWRHVNYFKERSLPEFLIFPKPELMYWDATLVGVTQSFATLLSCKIGRVVPVLFSFYFQHPAPIFITPCRTVCSIFDHISIYIYIFFILFSDYIFRDEHS